MPTPHRPDIGSAFSCFVLNFSREYASVSRSRDASRWNTTASSGVMPRSRSSTSLVPHARSIARWAARMSPYFSASAIAPSRDSATPVV